MILTLILALIAAASNGTVLHEKGYDGVIYEKVECSIGTYTASLPLVVECA